MLCSSSGDTSTISLAILHATPVVEPENELVEPCGVAIILPKTLIMNNQSHLNWAISLVHCAGIFWMPCLSLLLTNCDFEGSFDPCAVWEAVSEPPSAV